ncbi:unnamed protein product [Mytilus edulis]|uniref:Integrase zinc-binding domain-containing protein n=1 Tax=Mytilus edulis TaxID=6550 RepID=A0A8S3RQ51_MYTED|nr:unnamed protein product [Mytilus edulis]
MTKNQKFKDDYVSFMNNLFSKGFAEKVPITELNQDDGRVWYLPHHGIYHNKKPNKIRVVFDCSASYMGVSLNALLLQGPDLANNLIGVLLRFRTEKVALQGDIESMFYQVKVPLKDRNLLRFLWWPNGDMNSEPEVYRMTVHIFGATSSPSVCNFALRQTAQNYGNQFEPQVAETILNNIYVDDCLVSTESDEKAISLVDGVRSLCTKGGFNMTKWTSTSSTVVKSIPDKSRTKNTNQLDFENESSIERALGVSWYIDRDVFGFQINTNDHPHTKRGILSVVSSVYDPLGIASPFVLIGRSILQNLCKQQVDWDEEINETDEKKWISWLNQLNELHNVKIDRCYKPPNFENVMSTQIHCFSDASDIGYGMVFYLRLIDKTGRIHCSFVLGKSRVAPLKTITVPRMELTAAARAVRLSKVILQELNYNIDKVFFWTDSMTVLRYIFNRNSRYHTFVANRLALIHEATDNAQWNYVNTKQNPADFASRGMTISKFQQNPQWIRGPDYLWLPECEWPQVCMDLKFPDNDSEVKRKSVVNASIVDDDYDEFNSFETLISRCSDFDKLKRIVAWLLKAVNNFKQTYRRKNDLANENEDKLPTQAKSKRLNESKELVKTLNLKVQDIHNAEMTIIRFVQNQHFDDEVQRLKAKLNVKRTSRLFKLDSYIDEKGILRVGGRLARSNLTETSKHPIILPKQSTLSYSIIQGIHRSIGHLGKNAILTELRQKYWIIGANGIIKNIVSKCVICRKYQAPIMQQKMANLPSERVTEDTAPFTIVGMDYFGPFAIKQRRCTVKRLYLSQNKSSTFGSSRFPRHQFLH